MQIERLKYFVVIAKEKSLSVASEKLHISQQGLSLAVKDLEEELGVILLKRSNKGITLTKAGMDVLTVTEQITQQWTELQKKFRNQKNSKLKGECPVMIAQSLEFMLFRSMVSYFGEYYPEVILRPISGNITDIINSVFHGKSRVGFLSLLALGGQITHEIPENLSFRPFMHFKPSILINKQNKFAREKSLSFVQIQENTIALEGVEVTQLLFEHYPENRLIWVNSPLTARQMALKDLALTFTMENDPLSGLNDHILKSVPIEDDFLITIGMLYATAECNNLAIQAFLSWVEKAYG